MKSLLLLALGLARTVVLGARIEADRVLARRVRLPALCHGARPAHEPSLPTTGLHPRTHERPHWSELPSDIQRRNAAS